MELKYVKPLIALGVPGVSLGIFYLLYRKFDFSFSQVPPILTGAIVIVFLLIIGLVTIFALHRFAPKAAISTTSQAERLTTLPQQEQASLLKIRDIETIKMAFSEISLVALDNFIEDARSCILDLSTIHFYEGYKAVLLSNSFHLNNNQTQTRLVSLLEAWGTVLNAADSFVPTPGEMRHRLPKPHEVPSGTNLELIKQKFLESVEQMASNIKSSTEHISQNYPEINLQETSQKAWSNYVEHRRPSLRAMAEIRES